MSNWMRVSEVKPPENKPVMTKVDDGNGARNKQALVRRGNIFYTPDMSMYVYYSPTHWLS